MKYVRLMYAAAGRGSGGWLFVGVGVVGEGKKRGVRYKGR